MSSAKPRTPLSPGPRPVQPPATDALDLHLLHLLRADARASVAALARATGIAESTCAGRIRALRERGVIRGFHADIDPAALGRGVEAMVAIRFSGHVRRDIEAFRDEVTRLPGVLAAYNTSGAEDYLVHVAAPSADALRDLVLDQLTNRPGVVHVQTSLIFEATRGAGPLPRLADDQEAPRDL